MIRFAALLSLLMPIAGFATGQDQPARNSITLRVLAEVVPEDLGTVYLLAGEARTPAFDLPANNVSDPLVVPGRTLVLKATNKDLGLCKFTLPDAGRAFVVIFSPAKPAGYRAEVVRTDDPSFKRGDVFFLNRTDQTILGKPRTK